MDTVGIALSGLHTAALQLTASAHNLANLHTQDVTPLSAAQEERGSGGSRARLVASSRPHAIDLQAEMVDQLRASQQYRASLRMLDTELERRGQITDLLA